MLTRQEFKQLFPSLVHMNKRNIDGKMLVYFEQIFDLLAPYIEGDNSFKFENGEVVWYKEEKKAP